MNNDRSGLAEACTVTLNIVGDYVAKGSTDDAVAMDITVSDTAVGVVYLTKGYTGAGRVAIWNAARTATISQVNVTACPIRLWVQGTTESSAIPDVTVTATLKISGQTKDTDSDTVTVVEVASVTVDSGATQTNVTGDKNWVAVKSASEDVVAKAVLNPNITQVPAGLVSWTGGEPVAGQPLQRKVSKATSAKTRVTATCGTSSDYVDVWILWATVTIKMTGTTPANSAQFGTLLCDGTENLGAIAWDDGKKAAGKVAPYAVITPADVKDVVEAGWAFKRDRWCHDFEDGVKSGTYWDTNWTDDTSDAAFLRLTPDENDTIYDLDGPNVFEAATDSYETYNNFEQWVTWNATNCSDRAGWYWKGRWKKGENPEVTLKQIGTGAITLPAENGSYYKRVSGTITFGGNALQGVSVSCGGKTATTAADGTYTIKTVPPGDYVITPSKAGYTFTPATRNVTVPTDAHVTGQDFTATQP